MTTIKEESSIHSTAIIDPQAIISKNVSIGPYSIIGKNVTIGSGTKILANVIIDGNTKIGCNNTIFPFSVIGMAPQDLKFRGEESTIVIGDGNQIREYCTIHPGTKDGIMTTKIGNNCLFMISSHIAHDCIVGNNVILANNATLAGHVEIEDNVIIGGLSAIKQFVKIGKGAMVGGMSGVEKDIIPFGLVSGERASLQGLNLVGMKRRKINRNDIYQALHFFKELFENNQNESLIERSQDLSKKFSGDTVSEIANFILSRKDIGSLCRPKSNFLGSDFQNNH